MTEETEQAIIKLVIKAIKKAIDKKFSQEKAEKERAKRQRRNEHINAIRKIAEHARENEATKKYILQYLPIVQKSREILPSDIELYRDFYINGRKRSRMLAEKYHMDKRTMTRHVNKIHIILAIPIFGEEAIYD